MSEPLYNVLGGGRKYGPYSKRELASMLGHDEIELDAICIKVGDHEIQTLREVFDGKPSATFDDEETPSEGEVEPSENDEEWEEDELEEEGDELEEDELEGDSEDEEDELEEIAWEDGVWFADEEEEDDEGETNEGIARTDADGVDMDEIILHTHPSLLNYPKFLGLIALLAFVSTGSTVLSPLFGNDSSRFLAIFTGVGAVAVFLLLLFIRSFDDYLVTRSRVEVVKGILSKSSNEVRTADIRRIDVDKIGLLGLLNVGTTKFASAGSAGFDVQFVNVRNAHRLKKIIRRILKNPKASRKHLVHGSFWTRG